MTKTMAMTAALLVGGCAAANSTVFGAVDRALLLRDQAEQGAVDAAVEVAVRHCQRPELERLALRDRFDFGAGPLFVVDCDALPAR